MRRVRIIINSLWYSLWSTKGNDKRDWQKQWL